MSKITHINPQTMQDERIDRYLRGQMDKEEESLFENDLRLDAGLRSRARFIAQTVKALKTAGAEEGMISLPQNGDFRMVAGNANAKGKKKNN